MMSKLTLEERVAVLEHKVNKLLSKRRREWSKRRNQTQNSPLRPDAFGASQIPRPPFIRKADSPTEPALCSGSDAIILEASSNEATQDPKPSELILDSASD